MQFELKKITVGPIGPMHVSRELQTHETYIQLAPAMTHFAPEMGQDGLYRFLLYLHLRKHQYKLPLLYASLRSKNKKQQLSYFQLSYIQPFCLYELYEYGTRNI